MLMRLGARLRQAVGAFARERRGVAAVEFAFVAPIMIVLFIGTLELSNSISTSRKLSRLSSTLADLITQGQRLTTSDVDAIMDVSSKIMYPYEDQVKMVITGIQISNNKATVVWSRARNASPYSAGQNYEVPSKIKTNNTFLVAAKVSTSYKPTVGWIHYEPPTGISFTTTPIEMNEEIFLRPRVGSDVKLQ